MSVSIEQQVRRRHYVKAVKDESVYDDQQIWRNLERYLLVERSRFDNEIFVTTFSDPEDAADYHDGQEEPENWNVVTLVDLDTGLALSPITTTSWECA